MINSYLKTQTNIQKLIEQSLLGVRQNQNTSHTAPNVSSAPIVTLVDRIIQSALALRASDIHLDPAENQVRVRLRIDGRLSELPPALPLELKDILLARIKVMAQLDTTVHHLPLDGRITYPFHDGSIDIRVSTMPVLDGEKIVLRLLNREQHLRTLGELDFSPANMALFRGAMRRMGLF